MPYKGGMANATTDISMVTRLAKRLESEIQRRSLVPGDRFLTAVEAGRILGVSRATADRAMGVLARNEILLRRRSLGTFVGPAARVAPVSRVQTVYVIMPEQSRSHSLAPSPGRLIDGIRDQLQGVNVQFFFLPAADSLSLVRALLQQSRESGTLAGVVAVSCPREVYAYLAETGVATVVLGSLYLGGPPLASVDADNRQAGRLLMQHLLDRGHRRTALLADSDSRPGDHDFIDGISEVLSNAGLPHNALKIRVISPDAATAVPVISDLLASPDRPTGLIARSHQFVKKIEAAASECGLIVGQEVEIACQTLQPNDISSQQFCYPHVKTRFEDQNISATIGQMLAQQSRGEPFVPRRVIIPVELCIPT